MFSFFYRFFKGVVFTVFSNTFFAVKINCNLKTISGFGMAAINRVRFGGFCCRWQNGTFLGMVVRNGDGLRQKRFIFATKTALDYMYICSLKVSHRGRSY
jgi:hypothetical protein